VTELDGIVDRLAKTAGVEDGEQLHRLRNLIIESVHLVDRGANKRSFAVRKREGEEGAEVTSGADGTLTLKAESLPPEVKDAVLRHLSEVAGRLLAVIDRVKLATAGAGTLAADLLGEIGSISQALATMSEQYPAPAAKPEGEKKGVIMQDETNKAKADEDALKAKAKADEEEMAKAKAKADEEMAKAKAKPDDDVEKSGAKMSRSRLSRFQEAVKALAELAKELSPEDLEEKKSGAEKTQKAAPAPAIPTGRASSSDGAVQKRERPVVWGNNINDPQLHRDTADKKTSFFD
jgi:hypothetical protein